jgi:hypothetical protein
MLAYSNAAREICKDESISFVLDDYRANAHILFEPLAMCKKIGLASAYARETPEDDGIALKDVNGTSFVFGAGVPRDLRLVPMIELLAANGAKTAAVIRLDRSATVQCSTIDDDLQRNAIELVTRDVVFYDMDETQLEHALATVEAAHAAPDVLFVCSRTSLGAVTIADIRRSPLNFKSLVLAPLLELEEFDAPTRALLDGVTTVFEGSAHTTLIADAALFGSASAFADVYASEWAETLPNRLVNMATMLDLMREALRHAASLAPLELQRSMLTVDTEFMNGPVRFSAHGSNIAEAGVLMQVQDDELRVIGPGELALAPFRYPDAMYVAPPTPAPTADRSAVYTTVIVILVVTLLLLLASIVVVVVMRRRRAAAQVATL